MMSDATGWDREVRAQLELRQRERLAEVLKAAVRGRFYAEKLVGVTFDPHSDPLERLPLTTRAELIADQAADPPYGGVLCAPLERFNRLHQTSGTTGGAPLRWLDTPESWAWWKRCWSTVYDAADLRSGEPVLFAFSFGPFIGFWSAFETAAERGNLCLAAGGMSTSARLQHLIDNRTRVVCCTPTYALHLGQVAAERGIRLAEGPVRALIVAGEPGGCVPSVRAAIERAWGARVFDHAGMTEIGAWGFEALEQPGGLFVNEDEFIAEVLNAQTQQPAAAGEEGELVLTNLGRLGSPLIRYRTGDRVRAERGRSYRGRPLLWCAGGVLGRTDDMLIIRGNNVYPTAIEGIVREFDEVAEFRIVVARSAALVELDIEVEPRSAMGAAEVAGAIEDRVRDRLGFRPRVRWVPPGSLPRFEFKARRVVWQGAADDPHRGGGP